MDITVHGRPAFAATGGRPFDSGLPVVAMVHGAGMDRTVWNLQSRWFAHHGRAVLAFDLPGHGRSEGGPLPEIAAMADWLVAALGAAGVGEAALVGHSMGALVSLEAGVRLGERLRGLALVGAAPSMPVHPDLLSAAASDVDAANIMIAVWGHGAGARLGGHRAPGIWMVGNALRLLERARPGVLHNDLAACAHYTGAAAACSAIGAPTLVLSGSEDRMTPVRQGQKLATAIEGAAFEVLSDCGHMVMVEKPGAALRALAAFL